MCLYDLCTGKNLVETTEGSHAAFPTKRKTGQVNS